MTATRTTRATAAIIVAATAAVLLAGATSTQAHPEAAFVAARNAFAPTVTIPAGEEAVFANADPVLHSVTAVQTNAQGKPLFRSALVGAGEVAPVNGVDALAPGTYTYICAMHGGMTGTLVVLDSLSLDE